MRCLGRGSSMADYYSVIARAVSRLPSKTDEAKHGIYERARTALREALRNNDPPFSETELANEEAALDAAIHLVEVGGEIRQGAGDEACFAPETEVSLAEPTLNPALGFNASQPPN